MAHEDVIPIPIKGQLSKEVFNKIFRAMTRDNPLIYYVNQSACNWATDAFGHTAICPQYFYSRETVRKYNRNIENAVNNLAAQLKLTEGTDYEKEVRVHDWFCKNVKYDFKGADMDEPARVVLSHNIIGVFAKQKAQCEGIQWLLHKVRKNHNQGNYAIWVGNGAIIVICVMGLMTKNINYFSALIGFVVGDEVGKQAGWQ